jgi:hypothetical protein
LPVVLAHLAVLKFVSEKYLANKDSSPVSSTSSSPKTKPKVIAGSSPVEKKNVPAPMNSDLYHKKRDITSSAGGSSSPTSASAAKAKSSADVTSLADDVATKEEFKFDSEVATAVKTWLEDCLSITITDLINGIKSGVILCQLLNKIKPNTVSKIYEGGVAYLQMENVGRYIKGCLEIGMTHTEMFETNDLVNEKNLSMVLSHLYALASFVQRKPELNWKGPQIAAVQSRSLFAATLVGGELSDEPVSVTPLTPDQQALMDWANFNIMKSGRVDMTLSNLSADTRTSVKFIVLIEQLLGTPSGVPFNRNPTHMWHAMQNASLMLRYLSSQTFEKVDGVRAADIVLGNVNASCRFLSYLRDKFDLDFMFKGLLGPDIDTAGLGDLEDDVVEIELEEGEAVPEYLRTFIAAGDLAEIDEANRRAASPRTHDLSSTSTSSDVQEPPKSEPAVAPTPARVDPVPPPQPQEIKATTRRPSTSQPTTPTSHETKPTVAHIATVSPAKVDVPTKSVSPRRPSNPSTPTKPAVVDDKHTHLHVPTTSPHPKELENKPVVAPVVEHKPQPTPVEVATVHPDVSKVENVPVVPHPEPEHPKRDKTPEKPRPEPAATVPTPTPAPVEVKSTEEVDVGQAPSSDVTNGERPSSPTKTKSKAKLDGKISINLASSRPRSGKNVAIPLPLNSPRGDKRKVKVYKNQVQAEAQSQPATRDRSGSVALTADQQKRVADAQATVRMRVAQELLSTERNYVKSLKQLVSGLIEKARKESILTSNEISQCFSNIEDIAATNARLETELSQAVEVRKDTSGVPAIFKSFIPDMQKAYEPFISNYNNCMVALQILRLKNPKLVTLQQQFEEECMKSSALALVQLHLFLAFSNIFRRRSHVQCRVIRHHASPTYSPLFAAVEGHLEVYSQRVPRCGCYGGCHRRHRQNAEGFEQQD